MEVVNDPMAIGRLVYLIPIFVCDAGVWLTIGFANPVAHPLQTNYEFIASPPNGLDKANCVAY